MPGRSTETPKRRPTRDIVTQEGGVLRVNTDDVQEAWSLDHAEHRPLQLVAREIPDGMEGSYYL